MTENSLVLSGRPYALWLGRISREKGIDLLLKCWPTVLRSNHSSILLLAGSIYQRCVYEQLMLIRKELGIEDSVRYIGWAGREQRDRLLAGARCLLLPSHFESFGLVVVEALLQKTPVIASTGTPWEHIDNVAGRWLPRVPELWASSICDYITSPTKRIVPLEVVNCLLAPYSECRVVDLWASLLQKILS